MDDNNKNNNNLNEEKSVDEQFGGGKREENTSYYKDYRAQNNNEPVNEPIYVNSRTDDPNNTTSNNANDSNTGNNFNFNDKNDDIFKNEKNENNKKSEKKKKEKKPVTKGALMGFIAIGCVASLLFGILGGVIASGISKGGSSVVYESASTGEGNQSENVEAGTVSSVVKNTADSVVEIRTESVQTGNFLSQYVTQGAGSGVIISQDGYILTNNHVIANTSKVTVTLKNEQKHEAKIIGRDSATDIALLKIETTGLSAAVMGDSSQISVGDTAIAVGNPLGQLGGTVTKGIISALDREITINGSTMSLLQTDASINPGNSGGGLFNGKGELVGVVVAKSSGADIEGLGFAIPINKIKPLIQDLASVGYVQGRPALGATMVNVSDAQAALQYGVTQLGVYVVSVNEGSGAAKAGLQKGDMVQAIDNNVVKSTSDIVNEVQKHKIGDTVTLTIARDGKQQNISVTLIEKTSESTSSS
eukprot:TRINITY_DN210_c0_g1_i27.p1 TRINITY_DN210_c0_g1~~TRINITY_DN210_c0_g1_i27.p1  ORF type:complete len:475 (-),score=-47.97 TRINITY_DN210_c0_g1_i27:354-1778(-)